MIVKLTAPSPNWPLLLQTPGGEGMWDGVRFTTDPSCDEADAWVVYEGLTRRTTVVCPPSRTILATGEPPMIKSYPEAFTAQFARVLTCHALSHPGIVARQQALPWHYGREFDVAGGERFVESYDTLAGSSPFEGKTGLISVVCSAKRGREGHRIRDEFVSYLERIQIPGLDIFGTGRQRVAACKRDAIMPYRYHIVMENSVCPHYWTEKLADCYLGGAFPFYWGCPNLEEYFSSGAFAPIDIERPEEAVGVMLEAMESGVFERSAPLLRESRELVLNRYNLFPTLVSMLAEMPESNPEPVTVRPEESFTLRGRIRRARLGARALYRRARDLDSYA
ncbi:MAG: hypothetical protein GX181_07635 [Synergistaceae bacterium]|nr:glycosyltransferase family 10 [Synergistota bacterium]NLM71812.1 hypothetical protein [Synergistaceae bacterium]